ncbi:MAG: lysylphosphatidylglycerol synthase transmembrane domain-containing protein, partial [Anaerolineae bacterium]
ARFPPSASWAWDCWRWAGAWICPRMNEADLPSAVSGVTDLGKDKNSSVGVRGSAKTPGHRKALVRWALRAVGPLILIAILAFGVDVSRALALLRSVRLSLLLLAWFGIFPVVVLLRSLRWHIIARMYGIHQTFFMSILLYFVGMSAGFLISDGVSAFVRSVFLKRDGYRWSVSILTPFWEKTVELLAILLSGLVAFAALPELILQRSLLYLALILTAGILASTALLLSPRAQSWAFERLFPWLARRLPQLREDQGAALLAEFRRIKPGPVIGLVLFSIATRLLYFYSLYLVGQAMYCPLSFWQVSLVMALVSLVTMLPIGIGGVGTRDAVMLPMFGMFGQPPEQAIAFSFLILLTNLIWRALGSLAWVIIPRYLPAPASQNVS